MWNAETFPNPKNLTDLLEFKRRKLVTIIDPHIFADTSYEIANILSKNGKLPYILSYLDCLVKTSDGNQNFIGQCWPGTSYYSDFLNPNIQSIYNKLFKNENYFHNAQNIHTWIDMNEPSVFLSEETTMPPFAK